MYSASITNCLSYRIWAESGLQCSVLRKHLFLIHFSQVNSFFSSISCQIASFVSEEKNVLRRLRLPFFLFSFKTKWTNKQKTSQHQKSRFIQVLMASRTWADCGGLWQMCVCFFKNWAPRQNVLLERRSAFMWIHRWSPLYVFSPHQGVFLKMFPQCKSMLSPKYCC